MDFPAPRPLSYCNALNAWLRISACVSRRDKDGEIISFSGSIQSIDAERRAHLEIEASAQRFKKLLEKAPIAIFEVSESMNCTYFNEKYLQMFGVEHNDVVGLG